MTTKILGINGSPRVNGNTSHLLDVALDAAKAMGDVEVEKVSLGKLDMHGCIGCRGCDAGEFSKHEKKGKELCVKYDDDVNEVLKKMHWADGIIISTPVFYQGVSAQLKTVLDRTQPMLRYAGTKYKCGLANKVGGALVTAYNRNGGTELTIQAIHAFMHVHDMIVVGTGMVRVDGQVVAPGCYLGACGILWNSIGDFEREVKSTNAVLRDELGVRSAKSLGTRVTSVAEVVSSGLPSREQLLEQEGIEPTAAIKS
ncbi:MAG: flavodoxin family protein [Actinobacteria bacterium]|nr:flavodoxin family protein [Actinomycetota bacterium]